MLRSVIPAKAGIQHKPRQRRYNFWMPAFAGMTLLLCLLAFHTKAAPQSFMAPQGQTSSLIIFEQTGFARTYGVFTEGIARFNYDDQMKLLDNLKLALLVRSFKSANNVLNMDFSRHGPLAPPDKEREIAFMQTEPARFDNGKARIKGDLIINNIRKPIEFMGELNKYGHISKTTDVMEDGKETVGIALHANFKRSDYSMSADSSSAPFNDTAVLMLDLVGQR
jgi:polyisoprenoid-binding protein YceI